MLLSAVRGRSADVLVLCYHAVSERWPAELSVTPPALEDQLGHLARRGYVGSTFTKAITEPPFRPTVAVTFDDGYQSVADLGKPVLDRLGWPGTVFVPTGHIARERPMAWPGIDQWLGTEFERELVRMSWERLRELHEQGWEIGSHTVTHPRLTTLSDADVERELTVSRQAVEMSIGQPCPSLAYPYGDCDDRVVAAAGRAGYRTAGALPARSHRPEALRWPRVGVYHSYGTARYRRQVARSMRALQTSAAWPATERAWKAARGLAARRRGR